MKKKLFLFDIDGTLLAPGPIAREILNRTIARFTGYDPDLQLDDVAGFTDPSIIRAALRKAGKNGNLHSLVKQIIDVYIAQFEKIYSNSDQPFVYQDALAFLERIIAAGHPVALLTGNIRQSARIKLDRFGLFDRFSFGIFGDDGEDRGDLPWLARERAWDSLGEAYRFEEMVIVGDTANDARIAGENGMGSIIVCRISRWRDEILAARPTVLVDSLSEAPLAI